MKSVNIKDISDHIHSKLVVTTDDEYFEGTLKFVSVSKGRVTFEHVFELPSREYLGTMHMLLSSITSLKILESADTSFNISNFDASKAVCKGEFDKDERVDATKIEEPKSPFPDCLPPHLKRRCPNCYTIVDSISPAFMEAIEQLSKLKALGASFHGPKLSRDGIMSWISVSTPNHVFLFDIEVLSKDAFRQGLRRIFENDDIVKIIHDCRDVSDCLYHLFDTELKNVFDTQVADYLINMQFFIGSEPFKHVNSLDSCLFKYLKVPHEFLYNHNKSAVYDEEVKIFKQRPVSEEFINFLLKSSMYLLLLKEEQEKMLLSPFEKAVDLYLNSIRNATDSQVYMTLAESSQMAPACLLDSIRSVRFQSSSQEDGHINQIKNYFESAKKSHQENSNLNCSDCSSD